MKSESIKIRNTEHIEHAFRDVGYEFSLSPHPAMWDNYMLLSITNIETNRIITRSHYKVSDLDAVLQYLEENLDTVISLLKVRDYFELDGVYMNSDSLTVQHNVEYNSSRNSWYGTCRVSIVNNKDSRFVHTNRLFLLGQTHNLFV